MDTNPPDDPAIDFPLYNQHGVSVKSRKDMRYIEIWNATQPGSLIGHTHIDRYPNLMKRIADTCDFLHTARNRPVSILFAPCSVGYEPLSFARELHERGKLQRDFVRIHALDKNGNFIRCAKEFVIPMAAMDAERLSKWAQYLDFTQKSPNALEFNPELTRHIHFNEPQDILDLKRSYDSIVMMNFLYYFDGDNKKQEVLRHIFQKASSTVTIERASFGWNSEICMSTAEESGFVLLNQAIKDVSWELTKKQIYDNIQATFIRAGRAKEVTEIIKSKIMQEREELYSKACTSPKTYPPEIS